MEITAYVVDPDPEECAWIESVLAPLVEAVVVFDDAAALLAQRTLRENACLIVTTEPSGAGALELARELRQRGVSLPLIALGPHTGFRAAVDIARREGTDFLERPVTARQLRAAVRRACPAVK